MSLEAGHGTAHPSIPSQARTRPVLELRHTTPAARRHHAPSSSNESALRQPMRALSNPVRLCFRAAVPSRQRDLDRAPVRQLNPSRAARRTRTDYSVQTRANSSPHITIDDMSDADVPSAAAVLTAAVLTYRCRRSSCPPRPIRGAGTRSSQNHDEKASGDNQLNRAARCRPSRLSPILLVRGCATRRA